MKSLPIACTLTSAELHARQEGLVRRLMQEALEVTPAEEGCAFTLPPVEASLDLALELIRAERACCPFLRFDLVCEPAAGPIRLTLSGPEGTGQFLTELLNGAAIR